MINRALSLGILSLFIFLLPAFSQQEVRITTYYPVPYGSYERLAVNTLGIGDNQNPGIVSIDDAPNPATNTGEIWVFGDVGAGTITVQNKFDVSGSAAIGGNYAGLITGPTNGLLIENDTGIGVANPDYTQGRDLASHHVKFAPTHSPNHAAEGALYYDSNENKLMYYDNTSTWKPLGGGQLGSAVPVSSNVVPNLSHPAEGARAACPDGSVITAVSLTAGCHIGGSSNDCSASGQTEIFKITTLTAECSPLE